MFKPISLIVFICHVKVVSCIHNKYSISVSVLIYYYKILMLFDTRLMLFDTRLETNMISTCSTSSVIKAATFRASPIRITINFPRIRMNEINLPDNTCTVIPAQLYLHVLYQHNYTCTIMGLY